MTDFSAQVDQNEYLPEGGRTVDAVITVTAGNAAGDGGGVRTGPAPTAAMVIMVDCSGSMAGNNLVEAKRATSTAIDTLRDGVAFAVVAGTVHATMVYPDGQWMVAATATTRADAKAAVRKLRADGGTAIGNWLEIANWLFAGQDAQIKHGILLTDGKNQHQTPQELARILDVCRGKFTCDSRGVGKDWGAGPLLEVSQALLGTAEGLPDPAGLEVDFRGMTEAVMGKAVADVTLRLWTPASTTINFVKQVHPQFTDLTDRRTEVSARVGDYPLGAWGAESREYQLSVDVPAGAVGEEILAARVSVVAGDQTLAEQRVLARWTDDTALSTRINPQVAHYNGQAELAVAIQEGMAARAAGEVETATAKLGRAVRLAHESGREDTAKLLAKVVDVVDADSGTVRLKRQIEEVDAEMAIVRSEKTIRVRKQA